MKKLRIIAGCMALTMLFGCSGVQDNQNSSQDIESVASITDISSVEIDQDDVSTVSETEVSSDKEADDMDLEAETEVPNDAELQDAFDDYYTEIFFESGVFRNKNWDEIESEYNWDESASAYIGRAVPDQETAVEIAREILNEMPDEIGKDSLIPKYVFFDEEDELWIVSFWRDSRGSGQITLGGGFNVVIQKEDGKILKVW